MASMAGSLCQAQLCGMTAMRALQGDIESQAQQRQLLQQQVG